MIGFVFPSFLVSQTINLSEKKIRFCAGAHEWPPYYYFKRVNGKKTEKIVGFDIDLFNEIFSKNDIAYTTELLPWNRCLKGAMEGKEYDVVFGGGLNEYRKTNYVATTGYYNVIPSYFYAKKKFPTGVEAKIPSDLKNYGKLCGVRGFNYINFGQINKEIDMGSSNYKSLVMKTVHQRCAISFVRYEILAGWEKILNINFIGNEKLTFQPIPNNAPESFHLLISKNYKYAHELKSYFESEVRKLKRSGKYESLLNKYKQ